MAKGLGKLFSSPMSIVLGIVIGVVISHVMRSQVDGVWNMIPGLNTIKANYGYAYY